MLNVKSNMESQFNSVDLLIRGGLVFDGTGAPPVQADVAIRENHVVGVGHFYGIDAASVLDATGCWVCPGFIDVHTHSDMFLLVEPSAQSKIYQGVTTEIIGQCGASTHPLTGSYRLPSDWRDKGVSSDPSSPGCAETGWKTTAEYLQRLENARPAVNVVAMVGFNALRASVMGYAQRPADRKEIEAMKNLLTTCIEEGARGLSTGLVYPPGKYATTEEIAGLASVVAEHNGMYMSHMRSESSCLIEALDETIEIGRRSGVRIQVSHLKASGRKNWHLLDRAIQRIEEARKDGIAVAVDRYPYTASSTDLDIVLPDWLPGETNEVTLKRLQDLSLYSRAEHELNQSRDAEDWSRIMVGSVANGQLKKFRGMTILEIASVCNKTPAKTLLDLLVDDNLKTIGVFHGMSEENLLKIYRLPYCMVGSDASLRAVDGPLARDYPHPRAYGTFPRFIRMVLDQSLMPPEEMIRRMTSLPADHFRLQGRGRIQPGACADITVFCPETIKDRATYENPHQYADGITAVVVNGKVTFKQGHLTGERAGEIL